MTKRDVGSIRIEDTETRFEISADKAADYAEQLKRPGSMERGVVIAPAGEMGGKPWQAKPKFKKHGKPGGQHKGGKPKRSA